MSQIGLNPAEKTNAELNPKPALGWEVFVTPGIPIVTIDLPPGVKQAYFQAMASTLIHGERETTCLNVPSIGLVVAGDAAYNDVHLYLAESNAQTRREWISALDKIESLNPRTVVASHKRPENDDNPRIIEETRRYIRDFDRLTEKTRTAQELYEKMLELYPNRVNPGWALWSSARAVKP